MCPWVATVIRKLDISIWWTKIFYLSLGLHPSTTIYALSSSSHGYMGAGYVNDHDRVKLA
jgi:hypothetical protein